MHTPVAEHPASPLVEVPRPTWRDEYLRDVAALEKHAKEAADWQRSSSDPFERADAELWSRVSAPEACAIFLQLIERLPLWEATGQLNAAHVAENNVRLRIGTHGIGFEGLRECTPALPMRQNEVACVVIGDTLPVPLKRTSRRWRPTKVASV